MVQPAGSVIVRSKDSAGTIEAAFRSLRAQTLELEIVVVDSGSTDGTLELAREWGDKLVEIPAGTYNSGHALNLGAEQAAGDILFALSSHCVLPHDRWAERALSLYEREDVAAAGGNHTTPYGEPLHDTGYQRIEDVRANPFWGFSNHASSWRRQAWLEHRFLEGPTAEDKEWARRVLEGGWTIAFHPELVVEQRHRWRAGTIAYFRRERAEQGAVARHVAMPDYGLREALREWATPPDREHSRLFHLLNYRRAAGLLGKYLGIREARR
jgi:rhamnosyltransferase